MKKKFGLFILPALALTLGLTSGVFSAKQNQEERDARIIIQLKGKVDNKSREQILSEQQTVLSYVRTAVTSNVKVIDHFSTLVNAFSLEINSQYVAQIRDLPLVKSVTYDEVIAETAVDENEVHRMQLALVEQAEKNISAATMNVPENSKKGEGVVIAVLDDSFMIDAPYKVGDDTTYITHAAYTDLDDSVSTKLTQASIKSIVDSEPNFHGRYDAEHSTYLNRKVPFYYDYGGDNGGRAEDYNVFFASSSHGMHTSSIAGSNDPNYQGIAPKAQLVLMKAATTTSSSNGFATTCVVKALEDCYLLNVDVISMSFGSALAELNHENIAIAAISALKDKGVLMNVAAGNEGRGTFNSSAYENWSTDLVETGILGGTTSYKEVMSIASGQPDELFFDTALVVDGKNIPFYDQITNYKSTSGDVVYAVQRHMTDLLELPGHASGNFEWVKIPGLGNLSDFAQLGEDAVRGKIAVVDRGDITFKLKIENAITYGAIAVAIIDNDFSATEFNFRMALQNDDGSVWTPSVPVCSILNRNKVNFGEGGTASTCVLLHDAVVGNPDIDTVSDFSSDGILADLTIKPEITAPGTSILGAVYDSQHPDANNCYDYYSGTSMATPNYSGVCALMLSEHLGDAEYAKTLNRRLMSAATPLVDRYGTNFDSVRRQGAGMVNVGAALNTKVVLDGSSDLDKPSYTAKIELGNNDDIKAGRVNLNFTAISEETSAVNYHAKAYVYRPKVGNHLSEENYGERLANADLIATYDELIATIEKDVTINPGNNLINMATTLSDEVKAAIDGLFEFGCVVEGYVVLTATDKEEISLPFLGFYGDYSEAYPVEPFNFEKDPNKVYTSELLENICTKWFGKDKAQFSSNMIQGYWASLTDVQNAFSSYVNNEKRLTDFNDGANKATVEVGTDPATKTHQNTIYVGNNGAANTIIVSQFVTRTVANNTVTLTKKSDGKVALTTHLYDTFYGATYDGMTEVAWPLYKSYLDVNYYDDYIAHRARAYIPLYNFTYNPVSGKYTSGDPLADGEYTLTFHYDLAAGSTYEKSYDLVLDSDAPAIKFVKNVNEGGKDCLRIYYEEVNMSYVNINATDYEVKEDANGCYVDVPLSAGAKAYIKAYDKSYGSCNTIAHLEDERNITLSSSAFVSTNDFNANIEESDGLINLSFEILKNNKPATTFNSDVTVTINLAVVEELQITEVTQKGKEKDCPFTVNGNCVTFTGNSRSTFAIKFKGNGQGGGGSSSAPVDSSENGGKKGCGGSIITASSTLTLVALAGVMALLAKRKKDND